MDTVNMTADETFLVVIISALIFAFVSIGIACFVTYLILNKYNLSPNDPACFEFMEEGSHCGEEVCFHCKCINCGKLIHLHCDDLVDIQTHLLKEHHFTLDPYRTIFYGICEECRTGRDQ